LAQPIQYYQPFQTYQSLPYYPLSQTARVILPSQYTAPVAQSVSQPAPQPAAPFVPKANYLSVIPQYLQNNEPIVAQQQQPVIA
jgi:hypothetical protein